MEVRTRFAPSPTGFLHIGGARTALYSWLFARQQKGTFILRIEDTDLGRSTDESIQTILDSMQWLGLDYDEGPFYQSKRFERYEEVIAQLLDSGDAYRCYCSKERLEQLRMEQSENKQKPRYDGRCRENAERIGEQAHVIRFKNPQDGEVVIQDVLHGDITIKNSELDDLIIARTDGVPTYNLTVVVDDMDMKITHVIRGDDHINNSPRQFNILKALDATPPIYAHVPMILGEDGKRLSKRHGAVSVMQYRDEGYLPQALLNYLVRLGWSHGDQEIFSMDELIKLFDLKNVHTSAAAFDPEKLSWMNQQYLMHEDSSFVAKQLDWHMNHLGITLDSGPDLNSVVLAQRERSKTLHEMAEKSRYFYEDVTEIDEKLLTKHFKDNITPALISFKNQLNDLSTWESQAIHEVLLETAESFNLKLGKLAQPVRIAITGGTVSPPLDQTLTLLGKTRSIERLSNTLSKLDTANSTT